MHFLDWLFPPKEIPKTYTTTLPTWSFPPILVRADAEARVQKEMRDMLMVCLGGGMSYEDAKIAVNKELGSKLVKSQEDDRILRKHQNDLYKRWEEKQEAAKNGN